MKTVKKVAAETLEKLRDTIEIDRWRDKLQLTGKVKSIIERTLYKLPEKPYPESEIKTKKDKVYQHIYSSYFGSGRSVYKQTA